jgi:hypothetical protein
VTIPISLWSGSHARFAGLDSRRARVLCAGAAEPRFQSRARSRRSLRHYRTFYHDGTGLLPRPFSAPGVFPIAQMLTRAAMHLFASVGNQLVLVATRPDAG